MVTNNHENIYYALAEQTCVKEQQCHYRQAMNFGQKPMTPTQIEVFSGTEKHQMHSRMWLSRMTNQVKWITTLSPGECRAGCTASGFVDTCSGATDSTGGAITDV